ncbi:MAG: (2Fe-2S) ferredoxin domain-containing protein [Oligoflexia bacterium]|nr:(2Fe-2S) ferredoxin domain-containing protein [Oligoflexia bacterium]
MKENAQLKAHIFVCTNFKETGDSCGAKGASQLRDQLKANCAQELVEFKGQFRVNASGCLGHCEKGINAVLYPNAKWFFGLKPDDVELLKSELQAVLKKQK